MKRVLLIALASTGSARAEPGFFAAVGAGASVAHPFGELRVGRRFAGAPFFELGIAYSYDAAISELSFQTLGIAARTYLVRRGELEIFSEATASLALSSSGRFMDRAIGDRLLGAMLAIGAGGAYAIDPCWSVTLTVSTGTPVWLRSELAVQRRF
jgi:hypothetical protein